MLLFPTPLDPADVNDCTTGSVTDGFLSWTFFSGITTPGDWVIVVLEADDQLEVVVGVAVGPLDVGDTLHCTALLPVVETRPRTIRLLTMLVFGVLCFLVTTVCLVSGEMSSTLSAWDESTASSIMRSWVSSQNIKWSSQDFPTWGRVRGRVVPGQNGGQDPLIHRSPLSLTTWGGFICYPSSCARSLEREFSGNET